MDSVEELLENYRKSQKDLAPKTLESYLIDIEQFLNHLNMRFEELRPKHIMHYINMLNCSGRSANRKLSSLSSFFNYLISEDVVESNPTFNVKRTTIPGKFADYLKPEQVKRVLSTCRNIQERMIVSTFYFTGVRLEELRTSQLADLDLGVRELKVMGKGRRERYVLFPPGLGKMFTEYLVWREKTEPKVANLFVSLGGKEISRNKIEYMFRVLSKKSGVKIHPHKLRHSFATEAIKRDVSRESLKELLGHMSVNTTGIYVHAKPNVRKEYEAADMGESLK
jgi:integrase/recombinase XerC